MTDSVPHRGGRERAPALTIGVPAYRNAKTIRATLRSIQAQTFGDFVVVVSDDASPDNTAAICREVADGDPRFVFVEQPRNLNYGNFRYLVNRAETEYFMWLAGDDVIAPRYVEENLRILAAREDVVLSVSRCMFVRDGVELGLSTGTYPLLGTPTENLLRYIYRPGENTRMYGIMRTAVLKQVFPARDFFGYDFAAMASSLLHGRHYEVPEVLMTRDYTPRETRAEMMYRDGTSFLTRWFPVLALSREIVGHPGFPWGWKTTTALLSMNLYHHLAVTRAYCPGYARLLPPLVAAWDRVVAWRANPWRHEEIVAALAEAGPDAER